MKKASFFLTLFLLGVTILSCQSETKVESKVEPAKTSAEVPVIKNQSSEVTSTASNESASPAVSKEIISNTTKGTKPNKLVSSGEKMTSPEENKATFTMVQEERSQAISVVEEPEEDSYDFHDYKRWDSMLRANVSSSGKVNYASIKKDVATLDSVIQEFQDNYPGSGWSSTQKLTYWINAYNLFTIKLIVDNYPVSSITKITAKPWEKKFIQLGGKTYDLNTIENGIIRKQFSEPRIHFALNCASESCPILLNRAYTPAKLYSQLTTQTKKFLNDASKNDFSNPKSIKISSIFDWYGEDFKKSGTVIDFINKYRTEQLDNPKISYMTYSWDLND